MVITTELLKLSLSTFDRTLAAIHRSINTGAYMTEIVRGGILAVDKGQFEAATALGMTHNQTMRKIVLPQVVRNILPATGNEFVINIKDTSVLNVISVVELYFRKYRGNSNLSILPDIYNHRRFTLSSPLSKYVTYVIERRMDMDTYTTGANQMQTEDLK